ncbi:MAG TPA: hypothetical protein VFI47_17185 [Acidimicrobiales bacterium]|nr:hypothetical protein [Acidimicrobiales bacterium]
MDAFVRSVTAAFGLGAVEDVAVQPMAGSANRVWRFDTPAGAFVVKELSHDTPEHLVPRRRAAAFEMRVFDHGIIAMAEPVPAEDGEIVVPLEGSRDHVCAVRVHRWLDGSKITSPEPDMLRAAGASLHAIQHAGTAWSSAPTGSIRWWDVEPAEVADRLLRSPSLGRLGQEATALVPDALAIVAAADRLAGAWVFSHCDHKPENALAVDGAPAVLDWDDCGHCHPRLEAVEAALRWSGRPEPRRAPFDAFLTGYSDAGGDIERLSERDFGKWLAALLGWFSLQARRALGEWSADTEAERWAAHAMAADALVQLRDSLAHLSTWATWR